MERVADVEFARIPVRRRTQIAENNRIDGQRVALCLLDCLAESRNVGVFHLEQVFAAVGEVEVCRNYHSVAAVVAPFQYEIVAFRLVGLFAFECRPELRQHALAARRLVTRRRDDEYRALEFPGCQRIIALVIGRCEQYSVRDRNSGERLSVAGYRTRYSCGGRRGRGSRGREGCKAEKEKGGFHRISP